MTAPNTATADPLIGRWFHSLKPAGGTVGWQGQILGRTPEGHYLVQLHEWIVGTASDQQLVSVGQIVGWSFWNYPDAVATFYPTAEALTDWYRHIYKPSPGGKHGRPNTPQRCPPPRGGRS